MDYSPYYCKNFYKDRRKKEEGLQTPSSSGASGCPVLPPPENTGGTDPIDSAIKIFDGKPYRGHKKGKIFFSFLLVLLCFAIVMVSADMFSGGAVLDTLKETFGPDQLGTHYLLAKGVFTQKNRAEAEAAAVRENGGAGYLYNTAGGYYVISYCFDNRKSAETAKGKDNTLEIIEINIRKPGEEGLSDAQKKLCESALDLMIEDIASLYQITAALTNGTVSRESAFDTLTGMRNELLYKKEELINGGVDNDNGFLAVLEPLFGGLDAIVYAKPEQYFLEALRYVLIGAIVSFPRS